MSRYLNIALLSLAAVSVSCGSSGDDANCDDANALVVVGDKSLTESDLRANMPYGLSADDSLKFVRAYVRQWIEARLIGEIAARNVSDMDRIDRMVEDYRNELIMWEYRRRMYAEHSGDDINPDSLKAYYEANKANYVTAAPLVKGIYVKVPAKDSRLANIRKWCMSKNSEDLDKLEQATMEEGMEYEYFRDSWITWDVASRKLPGDFSGKVSSIPPQGGRRFEISNDSSVSILAISEYMPLGSAMPFELVEATLVEHFRNSRRPEYDRRLRQQLYESGVKDGIIKINMDLGIPEKPRQDNAN